MTNKQMNKEYDTAALDYDEKLVFSVLYDGTDFSIEQAENVITNKKYKIFRTSKEEVGREILFEHENKDTMIHLDSYINYEEFADDMIREGNIAEVNENGNTTYIQVWDI